MKSVGDLSNEDLLARFRTHVRNGHVWQAQLIAYLVEVENRQLHLLNAYPSMWDFCLRGYGMSESEAQLRFGLREASGKSVRAIEKMLAARFPKPDVPPTVELVQPQPPLDSTSAGEQGSGSLPGAPQRPEPRPRVEPLSPARYRIELTVSAVIKARLDYIQDLMRHANPSGDLETIFDRSILLLENELEKTSARQDVAPHAGEGTNATDVEIGDGSHTVPFSWQCETNEQGEAPCGAAKRSSGGLRP